jgi:hypothetical protein
LNCFFLRVFHCFPFWKLTLDRIGGIFSHSKESLFSGKRILRREPEFYFSALNRIHLLAIST